MYSTVITDCDYGQIDNEVRILKDISDVVLHQCRTEDDIIAAAIDADALIVEYAPVTEKVISNLKNCRVIVRYGVGVDSIDTEAAARAGIPVVNIPDYCIDEVSDHTCALILDVMRKITFLDSSVRSGIWALEPLKPIFPLRGAVLGLIAFGNIAREVATKMTAFGVKLLVYDPYAATGVIEKAEAESTDLPTLLRESDIISIHAPLMDSTYHMIGAKEFRAMKKTAVLVNTSRGGLVDSEALARALNEGEISGAAIDVVEHEPLSEESPLRRCRNLVITPHASFYSTRSMELLQIKAAEAVREVLTGAMPKNVVNRRLLH